jgi:TPR repeat protein
MRAAAANFERAAKQGHSLGQFRFGVCLYTGDGVDEQDHVAAAKWIKRAAEKGVPDAMFNGAAHS